MSEEEKPKRAGCGCWGVASGLVVFCFVIFVAVLLYFRFYGEAVVIESFEAGDTGWLVMGDAQGESNQPTYLTEGGNPGACMSAVDDAVGGVWYWAAPEAFRAEISRASAENPLARASLYFDLRQSDLSEPFQAADVILSDGNTTLEFFHEKPPGTEWTSYRVPLRATSGWKNQGTGEPADREEMERVLVNLEKLWIRGEFRTGEDTGWLDNVKVR